MPPKRPLEPRAKLYNALKRELRTTVKKACAKFESEIKAIFKSFEHEYKEVWIKLMVRSGLSDKVLETYPDGTASTWKLFDDIRYSWGYFLTDKGFKVKNWSHGKVDMGIDLIMDEIHILDDSVARPPISIKIARQEQILALCASPLPQDVVRLVFTYHSRKWTPTRS